MLAIFRLTKIRSRNRETDFARRDSTRLDSILIPTMISFLFLDQKGAQLSQTNRGASDPDAGAAVAIGALMIIVAAILAAVFPKLVDVLLNKQIALREGGRTFNWWREPPVSPRLSIYIYNVTNADEFLNVGEKPALQEIGPYVYVQHWEKVDVQFHDNDTLSYKLRKLFAFAPVSFLPLPLSLSSLSRCSFHERTFNFYERKTERTRERETALRDLNVELAIGIYTGVGQVAGGSAGCVVVSRLEQWRGEDCRRE